MQFARSAVRRKTNFAKDVYPDSRRRFKFYLLQVHDNVFHSLLDIDCVSNIILTSMAGYLDLTFTGTKKTITGADRTNVL